MKLIDSSIGDISEVLKTGKTPPSKNKEYFIHNYNWYTPGDIGLCKYLNKSERGVSEKAILDKKAFLYPENSLLITCIGNIGRVGISKEKAASNQQITAIKPKKEIDTNFLYYWFTKNQKLIHEKANNAVVPILNNKSLKEISFSYPPLKTQKRIATILDDAQALKQKNEQLLKEYDELAQSIFLDMFGDPVTNPKGFEKGRIRDYVEEAKYGTSAKAGEEGEFPYLRMNNLTYSGYMDYSNLKYIDVPESNIHKYLVKKGDLLFNRTNSKELVGKTAVFESNTPMIAAGYLIRVRLKHGASPYFIWGYLNSKHGKLVLNNMCKNIVGMANINAQELQNIKILKPDLSLQNQFAEKIKLIEQQKELAKKELKESEDLFQALLQKAFNNALNV